MAQASAELKRTLTQFKQRNKMHRPILASVMFVLLAAVTYGAGGSVPGNYTFETFVVANSGTLDVETINDNKVIVGFSSILSGSPVFGPFVGFERARSGAVMPIAN